MKAHPGIHGASDFERAAAFHQLSPNPVIAVDAAGNATFASDAAKRALEPLGPSASASAFFPSDMDSILAQLRRREPAALRREVVVGNRIFEENIQVSPDHDAVFIHATDITELRRSEQELHQQDAFLKALVESPTDIHLFALDRKCRYTAFNTAHRQEMKKLYGADIQPGTNLLDVITSPEVRSRIGQTIARSLTGESFTSVEFDSDLDTWHEFNWSPVRAPDGGVEGVTAFVRDITRRKRVETALAESELKYRSLFESSNDALMLLNTEQFFDCNQATLRVFGCSTRDEFLGKHPADVSPARQADGRDSRVAANEKIATAFRVGRNYFEWLHQRADGTIFPADVLLTPLDSDGRRVLQATVRDISDRKQAEAALRESEAKYRLLVDNAGEAIVVAQDGNLVFTNPRISEMVGYPREELLGRSLTDFIHPDDRALVADNHRRRIAGEKLPNRYEFRIVRRDGETRLVEISAVRMDWLGRPATLNFLGDVTERRQAEMQAEAERDRLRRILDAMPDGVYMVGQDWRLQYVNPALLARGGLVEGRKCYEYFHSRTEPCLDCANPQVFAGGTTHREYTTRQGDVTYDIQDVPVTGDDGGPARLVFLRDVTARKRTDEALRQSEARYKHLFEDSPSGVALVDADGVVQEANRSLLGLLGINREDLVGRPFRQLLPTFGLDPAEQDVDFKRRLAGAPAAREMEFRRWDGSETTIEVQSSVIGSPGKPEGVLFLVTDVTERKRAELRDKQHLADTTLLRDTALGFITLDPNMDIYRYVARRLAQVAGEAYIVVNSYDATRGEFRVRAIEGIGDSARAALNLLGRPPAGMTFRLSPEELTNYTSSGLMKIDGGLAALSSGELPEAVSDAIKSVFVLGETYAMSLYWQGRILGTVYILMHKDVPLRDPALVEAFVNQAAIAIQHRRDADELVRHREHLQELVRERTAELEAANRELEAFSYSVSHDLRAPLRAIDGFAQAVVEDAGPVLSQPARGHLDRVSAAAGRMGELIDDLLNLARIARLPLERKEVDLSELARNIAAELRSTAANRRAEFVIPDGLIAPADPGLVAMVLQNLLSNAWKFTSKHPAARIEFGIVHSGGERIFFVRDDGAGFDMAYVDKLFVPFQRLHSGHEFPGSGIGLAIVQRIVRRHGGRVWFEAEVNKGATCWFTLEPAKKEEEGGRET